MTTQINVLNWFEELKQRGAREITHLGSRFHTEAHNKRLFVSTRSNENVN